MQRSGIPERGHTIRMIRTCATLQLTICPHQNNAEGVSSLSITVYTDRQLTSSLRTRVKSVSVDAIASLADEDPGPSLEQG
jgi:hypothetical protein